MCIVASAFAGGLYFGLHGNVEAIIHKLKYMALQKSKQINSDISADYWMIESLNYDKPSKTLAICLALYTSENSRENEETPIHRERLQLNEIESAEIEDNIFEFTYGRLKTDERILPVLVSEEVPEVTENDPETGELIVVTPKIPAVYKSFFEDSEDC